MSTANRLKQRKKLTEQPPNPQNQQPQTESNQYDRTRQKQNKIIKHTEERQKQYQEYYEISRCNPLGISYNSSVFPHTAQLSSTFGVPMGFTLSPLLALDNDFVEVMNISADRVPRCGVCRAYMNCYNSLEKNKFKCFLCNRQTLLEKDYNPQSQQHLERRSSIFQCLGPANFYPKQPGEETLVFLIDIHQESASTQMLTYAIAAMKQTLSRPELDEVCIYFFTYDELLQCYDFSSEEIKCTIHDHSIQGEIVNQVQPTFLKDVRNGLFQLLDALEEISVSNPRKGSNFTKCFDLVFNSLKQTGAKFFILQCNQAIAGEQMFRQEIMKLAPGQLPQQRHVKGPSLFETCNKTFMDKYVTQALRNDCSFSYFTFARNYKNLKAISDVLKLCSSDLKVYSKDSAAELERFYYEFSYLLGATNFKSLRFQCTINTGWHFTAVYGNFYRTNSYITFQIPNFEPSRKLNILVAPSAKANDYNAYIPPFCCVQLITNYQYKRQSLLCVATIVQPVTGHLSKLYQSVDPTCVITGLAKGFLSSLRMDDINVARKKVTEIASHIYIQALEYYKKPESIPDSIISIIMAILAMLKSVHSQPEVISNTTLMDKVLSERISLQSSGVEVNNLFNPYLFNLTDMDSSMCQSEGQFVYPPTVDIKFHNVKEGLYLLDIGLALYLFIAKQCDASLLQTVFGKSKLTKNDELNESLLMEQDKPTAIQVQNLIKCLREQKSIGWVPLHVVRCGQNSLNERNFYLFFYGQKYEEFRSYRMNLQQFTAMISKRNSF